jgi:hypothetical protein
MNSFRWLSGLAALALVSCATASEETPDPKKLESVETSEPERSAPPPPASCEAVLFERDWQELRSAQINVKGLMCPDPESLASAVAKRRRLETAPGTPPRNFKDPLSPATPGLTIYERVIRGTALMAHITPVLFFETPPLSPAQIELLDGDPKARKLAKAVWDAPSPKRRWLKIKSLVRVHRRHKALLRALLLRGGFVFYEDPWLAAKIFQHLTLRKLFDEEDVYIRRGDLIHPLKRTRRGYVHAQGPHEGNRARLLIFDQVSANRDELLERRAWDLRHLRRWLGLKRLEVTSSSPDLLDVVAHPWEGDPVEGQVFLDENGAQVIALRVAESERQGLMASWARDRKELAYMQGVLRAGEEMVAERLRFDEPRREEGQQDGMLRIMWGHAYRRGYNSYSFNGVRYPVFTRKGRPNVPQVCIDFVFDSAERWSGAWWSPKGEPRERSEGFLDFKTLLGNERQVRRLVSYAKVNSDKFEVLSYGDGERVPYRMRGAFHERLQGWSKDVMPGDIVAIFGLRGDGRNHWHAFYVYDTDPLYNIPYLLIGNAGYAKISSWHDTMRSGPRRSIVNRIRMRPRWLETLQSE